jgi:SAM-dependent methyltransferase
MNLTEYRASTKEQERTRDLLGLVPASGGTALDIGARDGYFSLLLAERFDRVIALDLTQPRIVHPKITCVAGNAAALEFPADSIDFVFCAEVLEHLPKPVLGTACRELERVCKGQLLIGVPYRQDLRVHRTTCYSCLTKNPPWGHVNSFDERRLAGLFPACTVEAITFVGRSTEQTNALSCALMDLAGNPYGTYEQEEPCVHCGKPLLPPPERTLVQKVLTKLAFLARSSTGIFIKPRANWIHMLLSKSCAS